MPNHVKSIMVFLSIGLASTCNFAASSPEQLVQQEHAQNAVLMQKIQEKFDKQLKDMNSKIELQLKQTKDDLNKAIKTVNDQNQKQLKETKDDLMKQIKAVQTESIKAVKDLQ